MFNQMTDRELLDFCYERFSDFSICKALDCEEDCLDEDCPLVQLFERFSEKIR